MADEKMAKEYDFSQGTRGQFHRRGLKLRLPVYLDERALALVQKMASKNNADISTTVNHLLLTDARLAEVAD